MKKILALYPRLEDKLQDLYNSDFFIPSALVVSLHRHRHRHRHRHTHRHTHTDTHTHTHTHARTHRNIHF